MSDGDKRIWPDKSANDNNFGGTSPSLFSKHKLLVHFSEGGNGSLTEGWPLQQRPKDRGIVHLPRASVDADSNNEITWVAISLVAKIYDVSVKWARA